MNIDRINSLMETFLSFVVQNIAEICVFAFLLWVVCIIWRYALGHEPQKNSNIGTCIGLVFFYVLSVAMMHNPSSQNFIVACVPFINETYDGFDIMVSLHSDMMSFLLNLSKLMLFSVLFGIMEDLISGLFSSEGGFLRWYMGKCTAYVFTLLSMYFLNIIVFDPFLSWAAGKFSSRVSGILGIIVVVLVEIAILTIPILFSKDWLSYGMGILKSLVITLLLLVIIGFLSKNKVFTQTGLYTMSGVLTFIPVMLMLFLVWYVTSAFL